MKIAPSTLASINNALPKTARNMRAMLADAGLPQDQQRELTRLFNGCIYPVIEEASVVYYYNEGLFAVQMMVIIITCKFLEKSRQLPEGDAAQIVSYLEGRAKSRFPLFKRGERIALFTTAAEEAAAA